MYTNPAGLDAPPELVTVMGTMPGDPEGDTTVSRVEDLAETVAGVDPKYTIE